MIHSFSAADPTNPETIGGRWLAQGAFVFFGSVNEPFLPAFRTPRLVAALLAAEVPLVAALRQGEFEAFGFPWRLVYLGDPLYRLEVATPMQRRPIPARPDSSRSDGSPSGGPRRSWLGTWWNTGDRVPNGESDRVGPSDWQTMAPAYADWPILEIAPPVALDDPYWTVFLPDGCGVPILTGQVGRPLGIGEAFTLPPGTHGVWTQGVVFDGTIITD